MKNDRKDLIIVSKYNRIPKLILIDNIIHMCVCFLFFFRLFDLDSYLLKISRAKVHRVLYFIQQYGC